LLRSARNTAQVQFFVTAKQLGVVSVVANRRQNVAESIGHRERRTARQLYFADGYAVDRQPFDGVGAV